MSAIISVENLHYAVNKNKILNNINLVINSGEAFALIGKNGAGKTTLFEIILNDIKPTSGNINFSKSIGSNFENTGIVYDHLPLFPLLKVKEIIDYFSTLYNIEAKKIPQKYFEIFGLNGILNSFIQSLSLGERKKVSLFLSIIHNPTLLILDEPFSNIDPTSVDGIWEILRENDRTILFTTHNWKEVEGIASKVAFIYNGEIVLQPDTIKNVLQALPHNRKIITDYNVDLIKCIKEYQYYIHDNLIHVFYSEASDLVKIISDKTNNLSFKDCDIKDTYLFITKDYE